MGKPASHRFIASLVRLDHGLRHHALPVPDAVAAALKTSGVRRMLVSLQGITYRRALQNHADGGSYFVLGQDLLKTIGLKLGGQITVELRPDPQPDDTQTPEELLLVLQQAPEALARWQSFTPGRQRSLALYVHTAKQEATRIKRAWELADKIRTHSLYSDRLQSPKSTTRPKP